MKHYLEYTGVVEKTGSPREIYVKIKEKYIKLLKDLDNKFDEL